MDSRLSVFPRPRKGNSRRWLTSFSSGGGWFVWTRRTAPLQIFGADGEPRWVAKDVAEWRGMTSVVTPSGGSAPGVRAVRGYAFAIRSLCVRMAGPGGRLPRRGPGRGLEGTGRFRGHLIRKAPRLGKQRGWGCSAWEPDWSSVTPWPVVARPQQAGSSDGSIGRFGRFDFQPSNWRHAPLLQFGRFGRLLFSF